MNAQGRKVLEHVMGNIQAAIDDLQQLQEAEQEKFDNLSEGLQQSEKGQAIEEAAQLLEQQVDALESVKGELESIA